MKTFEEDASVSSGLIEEFNNCNSVYVVSDKESSSDISSDGEFLNANKINLYDEDDSMINRIEERRERKMILLYEKD